MLLLQKQTPADVRSTIDYCLALRRLAYASRTEDAELVCVCSGDQAANLPTFRNWMETGSDHVIDATAWVPDGTGPRHMMLTEVRHLFHIGTLDAPSECLVVIDAGSAAGLPSPAVIRRAIGSVTADHTLLVVPRPGRSNELPNWGVLSSLALVNFGVAITASSAAMISCQKGWFGSTRYDRDQRRYEDELSYTVPWLLGAIAFEYQRDRHGASLHVRHVRSVPAAGPQSLNC